MMLLYKQIICIKQMVYISSGSILRCTMPCTFIFISGIQSMKFNTQCCYLVPMLQLQQNLPANSNSHMLKQTLPAVASVVQGSSISCNHLDNLVMFASPVNIHVSVAISHMCTCALV